MFKKLTKKKQIYLSLLGGIISILLIIGTLIYKINNHPKEEKNLYKITEIKISDPLIFKGIVQPKNTSYFYLDQSLGKITNILVQNGQEIAENDIIVTYQNTTVEDQAEDQIQSLEKLNLAVVNARINLDNAIKKQRELETRLVNAQNKQIEESEFDSTVEAAQQALDTQKDAVLQAKQVLDAANVDLTTTNNSIEQTKKKITNTITSPFKGIVYTNDQGKVDSTIPYATVVSPETVIKGSVTEYDYNKIKVGQVVTINLINDEKSIEGSITNINALPEDMVESTQNNVLADKSTISTFTFMVSPKEPIHYGYNVQINVPMNNLEIAKKNTVKENNEIFVFVYNSGKVIKQKVEVKEDSGKYLVESGLKENESIIETPDLSLKDGQKVTVIQ